MSDTSSSARRLQPWNAFALAFMIMAPTALAGLAAAEPAQDSLATSATQNLTASPAPGAATDIEATSSSLSTILTSSERQIEASSEAIQENRGQVRPETILYFANVPGMTAGFARSAVYLLLLDTPVSGPSARSPAAAYVVIMHLPGATDPIGESPLGGVYNYFRGDDPAQWVSGVRTFERVRYSGVAPGIDVVFDVSASGVKYTVYADAAANLADFRITFAGATGLEPSPEGGLVIHTPLRDLHDAAPTAFEGAASPVECGFELPSALSLSYSCPAWDGQRPLSIDPLIYSTYIGGYSGDEMTDAAFDASGNGYFTGETWSSYIALFPTTAGAFDTSFNGGSDTFVTKLASDGASLVYSTLLGGSSTGGDRGYGIAVDGNGSAYVVGSTWPDGYPVTPGGLKQTSGSSYGTRGFVTKLSPDGSSLAYSTYFGGNGSNSDLIFDIAVDSSGYAYLLGQPGTPDYPTTPGAFQTTFCGGCGGFAVSKLNVSGDALVYSTFVAAPGSISPQRIDVNAAGQATVIGWTGSASFFNTSGAYDRSANGNEDAFLLRLNAAGNGLTFSTYLGGSNLDRPFGLHIISNGSILVTGYTSSTNFPVGPGAYDRTVNGTNDIFVARFDANATMLEACTYLGGSADDLGTRVTADASGAVWVVGQTGSNDFPVSGAIESTSSGSLDGIAARLNENMSTLFFGSYFGGDRSDFFVGVGVDATGNVSMAGSTQSWNNLTTTAGAYDRTYNGINDSSYQGWDMFSLKIGAGLPARNLAAQPGPRQVRVAWVAPSDAATTPVSLYRVYVGDAANNTTTLIAQLASNTTSFNHTGLTDGQTYFYRVGTVSAVSEVLTAAAANATPRSPPTVPLGLGANAGNRTVALNWSAPALDGASTILGYRVYRGNVSGNLTMLANLTALFEYNVTNLTNGQGYYFAVSAYNAIGESNRSAEILATPSSVPSEPVGLAASASDGAIAISWSPPLDLGGLPLLRYRVFRGPSAGSGTWLANVTGATAFNDTSVINGATYYYSVSAVNSRGEGPLSLEASATPGRVPSAPQGLAASVVDGAVELQWTAPADDGGFAVASYTLYRGSSPSSLVAIAQVNGTTAFTDQNVTLGQTYYYAVAAANVVGEGNPTSSVAATPVTLPSEPVSLSAVSLRGAVSLTWSEPTDLGGSPVTGFVLLRGASAGSLSPLVTLGPSTSYTDTNISYGATYYYAVQAVTAVGTGPSSLTASSRALNEAPSFAGTPPSSVDSGGSADFTFTASDAEGPAGLAFELMGAPFWIELSAAGSLHIAPPVGVHGSSNYTVVVRDSEGAANQSNFTVTVGNRAPAFSVTFCGQVIAGEVGNTTNLTLALAASDPDDPASALVFSVASSGAPRANATISAAGDVVKVLFVLNGSSTVTLRVRDPPGLTAECSIQVVVTEPPAPEPVPQTPGNTTGDQPQPKGFLPGNEAIGACAALAIACAGLARRRSAKKRD